jgi:hypothetical protein
LQRGRQGGNRQEIIGGDASGHEEFESEDRKGMFLVENGEY